MKIKTLTLIWVLFSGLCCSSPVNRETNLDHRRYFRGIIQMSIADNFKQGTAQFHYKLKTQENGRIMPLILHDQQYMPNVQPGSFVEIIGKQQNQSIIVEKIRIIKPMHK